MRRRLDAREQLQFDHVDRDILGRVTIMTVPWLPSGAHGMSLRRTILLRRGHEHKRTLLAHELVHTEQWHDHGVIGFSARYLTGYLRGLARYRRHHLAYLAIPFERAARRRAAAWARNDRIRRSASEA